MLILFDVFLWLALCCACLYAVFYFIGCLILVFAVLPFVFLFLDAAFAFFFGKGMFFSCEVTSKFKNIREFGLLKAIFKYQRKKNEAVNRIATSSSTPSESGSVGKA